MSKSLIVLIATAGEKTLLNSTLESLSKCILPASYRKTIVVENGKKFHAEKITANYTSSLNAQYLYNATANKSTALNYAIDHIVDDTLVFFTDDDVVFADNLLVAYAKLAFQYRKGYFFGGPTLPNYEQQPPAWLIPNLPPSARGYSFEEPFNKSMFLGFNWAAFAGDVKQVGGFDSNFGPGTIPKRTGQETDMQKRLLEFGLSPMYVSDAMVWHFVPSNYITLRWLLKRKYEGGRGKGLRHAIYSKEKLIPFSIIIEVLLNILSLLSFVYVSKEKRVSCLCNLITSVGKIRGFYMK
jgi:glycosyltransferase involved in cell wall biosynthesis